MVNPPPDLSKKLKNFSRGSLRISNLKTDDLSMANTDWFGFFWKAVSVKSVSEKKSHSSFLSSVSFFDGFSKMELKIVQDFLHERTFKEDEFVFEKGQPGAAVYFIVSGKIAIEVKSENGSVRHIADLHEGSFFGELALLDDSPRSATARAATDLTVLVLARSELDRMLEERPLIAGSVYRNLARMTGERLKSTIERIQKEQSGLKVAS